jgi:glutathione peroxidase
MIGRRPNRSDSAPSTGDARNCITAQDVPKTPITSAARAVSPPSNCSMSFGSTGMITPSASMSSITVMKMNVTAARDGAAGAEESDICPAESSTRSAQAVAGYDGRVSEIHGFEVTAIDGETFSLERYRGRPLLIVNVASRCGMTPQYAGLESLYRKFKDRGLVVLGFPCNQFGGQEPGSAQEIGAFCRQEYDITFPMFMKVDVNGPNAHPLFRFLKSQKKGLLGYGSHQMELHEVSGRQRWQRHRALWPPRDAGTIRARHRARAPVLIGPITSMITPRCASETGFRIW